MLHISKNAKTNSEAKLHLDFEINDFILDNAGKDVFPKKTAKAKELLASLRVNKADSKFPIETMKINHSLDKYEDRIVSEAKFKKAVAFAEVWAEGKIK